MHCANACGLVMIRAPKCFTESKKNYVLKPFFIVHLCNLHVVSSDPSLSVCTLDWTKMSENNEVFHDLIVQIQTNRNWILSWISPQLKL